MLLAVLAHVNAGDCSERMPLDWTGVYAKAADAFNDPIVGNQASEPGALEKFDLIPILAMTGKVVAGERERCIQAGADEYIPAPVTTIELMGAIAPWPPAVAPPTP